VVKCLCIPMQQGVAFAIRIEDKERNTITESRIHALSDLCVGWSVERSCFESEEVGCLGLELVGRYALRFLWVAVASIMRSMPLELSWISKVGNLNLYR
jgi:hypothetical protein